MDKNILIIDSTTAELWVAFVNGNKVIERVCDVQRAHDKNINRLVKEVLAEGDGGFASIAAFAVVTGPGSWTGCRVGVAAVKAYAAACSRAKVIELRANSDRAALVKTAKQKFAVGDFVTSKELLPFYDGEFVVTTKKH